MVTIKMGLEEIIDKFKINLFAEAVAMNGALCVASCFLDGKGINAYDIPFLALTAINFSVLPPIVKRQNKRYDKLVDYTKRYGYNQEAFGQYMNHPCGRFVVKAALKRLDMSEKYEELKDKYPLTRLA